MKIRQLHPWKVTYREAIEIQKRLRSRLEFQKLPGAIRNVAGMDVSSSKKSNIIWAGVVIVSYRQLDKVEEKWIKGKADFPYIPGLLSFREIPVLLETLKKVETEPDVILCDGQGIAHPRGLGIASHLGLLVNKPTIGCAKSRLVGEFSGVEEEKGSYTQLRFKGREVGMVVRTRRGVKPIFVSQGNNITIEESLKLVINCCSKYRIPEPNRQAHLLVNSLRRREEIS